ncbi:dGTP triphosphohydrolase [Zymomonas sp.]|uniref:dGTP triphosphohydrolase n=1 Tax=Zymomonas sp. TaxID=2068624 RepID=UPI0025ECB6F2|nr:dNTP triphosphohydrolase [Zymomonas sp.]MCA1956603.1 dNTP triphosphohydrolase [Zymomonas sp.]
MEWKNLLNHNRLGYSRYAEDPDRPAFVQDADRITFSTAFRRLANKTQVHPLYENDHIHHRLIHSVETASVGRSLGMRIGRWLENEGKIEKGECHTLAGIVQAACLAHDIGNPPFGHAGENAIGEWFSKKFEDQNRSPLFKDILPEEIEELKNFDGNAQGFRLLTRLEMYRHMGGMRLSYGVLGAFVKYPVTASIRQKTKTDSNACILKKIGMLKSEQDLLSLAQNPYCGLKKIGIFKSELGLFKEVAEALGLKVEKTENITWWRRDPLVFLVEAADDICYNILDLEDAYASGDLSKNEIMDHFEGICKSIHIPQQYNPAEEIARARSDCISKAINACVDTFKAHYDALMSGQFSTSLIEESSIKDSFKKIKKIAKDRLFTSRRKTELEVYGRNVVHQILEGTLPIFESLMKQNWDAGQLEPYHRQLCQTAALDIRDVRSPYEALHALTDCVSAMTDRYAVKIAKNLSGN